MAILVVLQAKNLRERCYLFGGLNDSSHGFAVSTLRRKSPHEVTGIHRVMSGSDAELTSEMRSSPCGPVRHSLIVKDMAGSSRTRNGLGLTLVQSL